jgi:aspartyl-tRNA(Asn)/glutamyl-tRNA(Gln) amidotransferase subunit B
MIEDVITANPENAIKVLEQPRLAQWFVGQVMKASKGKASAAIVQEKLKLRFGIVD